MTILLSLAFAVGLGVMGVYFFAKALSGLSVAARVLRQPTIPTSKIATGPVEVRGTVAPIGEVVTSLEGTPCVAVKTIVTSRRGTGKNSKVLSTETRVRVVPARVTDASGTCRLDLDLSAIVGPRRAAQAIGTFEMPSHDWLQQMMAAEADNFDVEETIVPVGSNVLVSGDATETDARLDVQSDAYRGASLEWKIEGRAERLLVISVGSQMRLVAVTVLPAVLLLLLSLHLLALAGGTALAAF